MGRPRLHDDQTRAALLDAAERIVEAGDVERLSVRGVADAVGTTTRAIYSVFGSKEELLIALGQRAFELLGAAVDAVPVTADPGADLVAAGAVAFRDFALGHPALFRVGIQRTALPADVTAGFSGAAASALSSLHDRLATLALRKGLGGRSASDAAWQFHALCEGLAALELRHRLPAERALMFWTDALTSLLAGWSRS